MNLKRENTKKDLKSTILGIIGLVITGLVLFGVLTQDVAIEVQDYLTEIVTAVFSLILIFGNLKKKE